MATTTYICDGTTHTQKSFNSKTIKNKKVHFTRRLGTYVGAFHTATPFQKHGSLIKGRCDENKPTVTIFICVCHAFIYKELSPVGLECIMVNTLTINLSRPLYITEKSWVSDSFAWESYRDYNVSYK